MRVAGAVRQAASGTLPGRLRACDWREGQPDFNVSPDSPVWRPRGRGVGYGRTAVPELVAVAGWKGRAAERSQLPFVLISTTSPPATLSDPYFGHRTPGGASST